MGVSGPQPRCLPILERLIALPTVSAASNLELIDLAEEVLRGSGFAVARLNDSSAPKAGLAARLGPDCSGGILLSAHSDVVPVEGQDWGRNPFRLTREDDRLFGRGTTDMKGFLAAMLALSKRAATAPLTRPLMMVISYDEEVGCKGIRQMMPAITALGWRPELCIVGEPTDMRPAPGHKGKAVFEARCVGEAGHSAQAPDFVNALHLASDLISALRQLQDDYRQNGARDDAYGIPYSTVHAGILQGGRSLNIVPDAARVEFELRHLPQDRPETFLQRLRDRIDTILHEYPASAGIKLEPINAYPGLEVAPHDPAMTLAASLSGHGVGPKLGFGTEAGHFAQAGWPCVVCGPGNMAAQGHKPDEHIDIGQLLACERMLDRVLAYLQDNQA